LPLPDNQLFVLVRPNYLMTEKELLLLILVAISVSMAMMTVVLVVN
jgi:hypothetical protein